MAGTPGNPTRGHEGQVEAADATVGFEGVAGLRSAWLLGTGRVSAVPDGSGATGARAGASGLGWGDSRGWLMATSAVPAR